MSNELSTSVANVPDFIASATDAPKGLEEVQKVMQPSIMRVVQALTQDEIVARDQVPGDVVLMPERTCVFDSKAETIKPTRIVPVFFFTEWCVWNPLKTKGQLPFIRERSMDPNGDIARKAKTPDLRKEPCPEMPTESLRYMEHLTYLVVLMEESGPPAPVLLSFVSGEHKTGRRFANMIVSRGVPIYAGAYEFITSERRNPQGKWFGLDISNSSEPWVTQEQFEIFKQLHIDLKERIVGGDIIIDYEAAVDDGDVHAGDEEPPQDGYHDFEGAEDENSVQAGL